MEDSWENWDLHMEIDPDEDFLLDNCHTEDDDEFLRDILLQHPAFSSESETDIHHSVQNNCNTTVAGAATYGGVVLSSDQEMGSAENKMVISNSSSNSNSKRPRHSSSTPRTYILSFDDSTMIPVTPEAKHNNSDQLLLGGEGTLSSNSSNLPSKRKSLGTQNTEPIRPKGNNQGGGKKARSSSQITDHIMAERKRRQELTERFIALSATIPGLNKTDKASILRAAIDYVKQLQERVQELEKEEKNRGSTAAESVIFIKRSDLCGNIKDSTTSSETSSDDGCPLPEIEVRVLGKEVLIEIHCEKENGIELKMLDHLENLQLCVTGNSVLPFGNSTLGITIIAQMGSAFKMTANDLAKNLRQVLLKSACKSDPY